MIISKKNIILLFLIIIGGCQQCILEHQADPKLGFDPQTVITNTNEIFEIDIIINEIESPFFGMTFQLHFDSSKIDLNCKSEELDNPFFGTNYLAQFINPDGNKIYSSFSLFNGQDPVSGSGNIAECTGFVKSSGTAYIEFIPNSFYFINEFGDELLNPINLDSTYKSEYSLQDSSLIIFNFELLNASIVNTPENIDN